MQGEYAGDLRCTVTHGPSGDMITTDAPADNQGKGEAFSPTDLVAAALGSCILTVMGIAARKHNINMNGATADIEKEMVTQPERKIGRISAKITLPASIPTAQRQILEDAGSTCPVYKSLHPDVTIEIIFQYQ